MEHGRSLHSDFIIRRWTGKLEFFEMERSTHWRILLPDTHRKASFLLDSEFDFGKSHAY